MKLKRSLRQVIEALTGRRIYRILPRGVDIAQDLAHALPAYRVDTIFDVGANIGQSAREYLRCFPGSRIYCFEPAQKTFCTLQNNLRGQQRIRCFNQALGAAVARGKIVLQGSSEMFFVAGQANRMPIDEQTRVEEIDITTIDAFCHAENVGRISYLKVDTEGGDLEVLKGAANMLVEQRIDFVQVEAGMNVNNKWHVPFELLKGHLESSGYFLFGIYDQMAEWPTNQPHLRRTNPVFIAERAIRESAG